MTVSYKGYDPTYKARLAEISFDWYTDEERDEQIRILERIAQIMAIKGWNIEIPTGEYGYCRLANREEYDMFMRDWKECKRAVALWERHRF
jgi:hypothetical protein